MRQDAPHHRTPNEDQMSTVSLLADHELAPAAAVFADIRATRKTDFVNNFWRALVHDPALLERTWAGAKQVMARGALDAKTKDEPPRAGDARAGG
jgi:hypothetical protein